MGKKNLFNLLAIIVLFASGCMPAGNGELIGVQGRELWYPSDPFGTLFIPSGSYHMGQSDQDINYSQVQPNRVVSVHAFYMDDTEISNNEYRQFVYWVRDSIARKLLAGDYLIDEGEYNERIDWYQRLAWEDEENKEILDEMFLPEAERFYRRYQIDTRKLNFEYWWIDYKEAAKKSNRNKPRSTFIKSDIVNVYPDTLAWFHDFVYSFNDPMTQMYFWHPAYDDYPVVGVTWRQARAFSSWRTYLMNNFRKGLGLPFVQDFRLPTESEWEYAARGGYDGSPYPWGGPYIRNTKGCFLGNFKPLRGNYMDDGGFYSVKVTSYWPNAFGLYCMAGNVAEWTSNTFDESAFAYHHDLNADYRYDAQPNDPPALKRKVIKGGSWKDLGYFMQAGTRSYEYQDTSKCYIGFRNVMSFLGRDKSDFSK